MVAVVSLMMSCLVGKIILLYSVLRPLKKSCKPEFYFSLITSSPYEACASYRICSTYELPFSQDDSSSPSS